MTKYQHYLRLSYGFIYMMKSLSAAQYELFPVLIGIFVSAEQQSTQSRIWSRKTSFSPYLDRGTVSLCGHRSGSDIGQFRICSLRTPLRRRHAAVARLRERRSRCRRRNVDAVTHC